VIGQSTERSLHSVGSEHCHAAGELAPLADRTSYQFSTKLDWEAARQITTGTGMLLAALLTCLLQTAIAL